MARRYMSVEEAQVLVGKVVRFETGAVGLVDKVIPYHEHYGRNGDADDDRPVAFVRKPDGSTSRRYVDVVAIEIYEE